jgi:uncharacterized protein
MYDPDTTSVNSGQWFELFNQGEETVNLRNWIITDSTSTQSFDVATDVFIHPQQYVVFASSVGNFSVSYQYDITRFVLSTTSANVILLIDVQGVERDRVVYLPNTDNKGKSVALRSPESDNTETRSIHWCISNTLWSESTPSDFGTPGAANQCPPLQTSPSDRL